MRRRGGVRTELPPTTTPRAPESGLREPAKGHGQVSHRQGEGLRRFRSVHEHGGQAHRLAPRPGHAGADDLRVHAQALPPPGTKHRPNCRRHHRRTRWSVDALFHRRCPAPGASVDSGGDVHRVSPQVVVSERHREIDAMNVIFGGYRFHLTDSYTTRWTQLATGNEQISRLPRVASPQPL